jgi:hypothetical protein
MIEALRMLALWQVTSGVSGGLLQHSPRGAAHCTKITAASSPRHGPAAQPKHAPDSLSTTAVVAAVGCAVAVWLLLLFASSPLLLLLQEAALVASLVYLCHFVADSMQVEATFTASAPSPDQCALRLPAIILLTGGALWRLWAHATGEVLPQHDSWSFELACFTALTTAVWAWRERKMRSTSGRIWLQLALLGR